MRSSSVSNHEYMAQAIALARLGLHTTMPNPRVGCVIVNHGQIVGQGWHVQAGKDHAEALALQAAGNKAKSATLYVTLEPCCHIGRTQPCVDAIISAGISQVVLSMEDPNPQVAGGGIRTLQQAGMAVQVGLLEAEARALNPGFIKRMRTGLPWVRLKLAGSLDGRSAMASGESQWITSAAARRDVQRYRARSCAILSSINTLLADDPALNLRQEALQQPVTRQPWVAILDSSLRLPLSSRLLRQPERIIVFYHDAQDSAKEQQLRALGVTLIQVARQANASGLDILACLGHLGRLQMNELWVECGATLAAAFMQQQCVDEFIYYQAPLLLGSQARPLIDWPLQSLSQACHLQCIDSRWLGQDLRMTFRPASSDAGSPTDS